LRGHCLQQCHNDALARTSTTTRTISTERGERNLSILNLRLLAKVLRVSLAELVAGLP
jgi:hypothetical protein